MLLWTRCCKRGRLTHLDAKPVTQSWRIYWVSFGSQSLGAFLSPTNVLSVCQVLAGNSEKNCSTAAGTWPILLAGDRNVHRWNWAPVLLFSLNRTTRVTCVFCKPQEISAKKSFIIIRSLPSRLCPFEEPGISASARSSSFAERRKEFWCDT